MSACVCVCVCVSGCDTIEPQLGQTTALLRHDALVMYSVHPYIDPFIYQDPILLIKVPILVLVPICFAKYAAWKVSQP